MILLLLGACAGSSEDHAAGDGSPGVPDAGALRPLIDHGFWQTLDADEDPFDDGPDGPVSCPGLLRESLGGRDVLSVDTRYCDYVTVRQPALRAVKAGDSIGVIVGHFDLLAVDPAEAHVAVAVDGTILWEKRIEIPSDAAVYDDDVLLPFDVDEGMPIDFHLHNHGANEWFLATIEVRE